MHILVLELIIYVNIGIYKNIIYKGGIFMLWDILQYLGIILFILLDVWYIGRIK